MPFHYRSPATITKLISISFVPSHDQRQKPSSRPHDSHAYSNSPSPIYPNLWPCYQSQLADDTCQYCWENKIAKFRSKNLWAALQVNLVLNFGSSLHNYSIWLIKVENGPRQSGFRSRSFHMPLSISHFFRVHFKSFGLFW